MTTGHEATLGLIDVSRLAKSVGIGERCLMTSDVLGVPPEQAGALSVNEDVAAKAMGILFWLRRSWSPGQSVPPSQFEAKTAPGAVRYVCVDRLDGSLVLSTSRSGVLAA